MASVSRFQLEYAKRRPRLRVCAITGDTILVTPEPIPVPPIVPRRAEPGMASDTLRRLSARGPQVMRRVLSPREYRVVVGEDGSRSVNLAKGQLRVSDHPAYLEMAEFAAQYAREKVDHMAVVRMEVLQADIADYERLAADIDPEGSPEVADWRSQIKANIAALPEPWQGLIRCHGHSYAALRDAPAPLGPLVVSERAVDETERDVRQVVAQIRVVESYIASENRSKAFYLRAASMKRASAERITEETASAGPAPR